MTVMIRCWEHSFYLLFSWPPPPPPPPPEWRGILSLRKVTAWWEEIIIIISTRFIVCLIPIVRICSRHWRREELIHNVIIYPNSAGQTWPLILVDFTAISEALLQLYHPECHARVFCKFCHIPAGRFLPHCSARPVFICVFSYWYRYE